ncbi:MAG: hypothetical protein R3F31_16015 [Verrucomicrobiales bacterium]
MAQLVRNTPASSPLRQLAPIRHVFPNLSRLLFTIFSSSSLWGWPVAHSMNPVTRSGAVNHRNISFCRTKELVTGMVDLPIGDGDPKVVMNCHDCQQIVVTSPRR